MCDSVRIKASTATLGLHRMAIGHIPHELIQEFQKFRDSDSEDYEWLLRKVKWALEPLTNISAAEHQITVNGNNLHVSALNADDTFQVYCESSRAGEVEATNCNPAYLETRTPYFSIKCA